MNDQVDPNELLATIRGEDSETSSVLMAITALDTACLAGRPPSEYLRALAKRAREKAISPKSAWVDMALKLERWADE